MSSTITKNDVKVVEGNFYTSVSGAKKLEVTDGFFRSMRSE
jgi:hypothetical protein